MCVRACVCACVCVCVRACARVRACVCARVAFIWNMAVSVMGQSNAGQRGVLQYAPPQLTDELYPYNCDSAGGCEVAFSGTNFGHTGTPLQLLFVRSSQVSYPCVVVTHSHVNGSCIVGPGAGKGDDCLSHL